VHGDVKASVLFLLRDPEEIGVLEDSEDRSHGTQRPDGNDEEGEDLKTEKSTVAMLPLGVEDTTSMVRDSLTVGFLDVVLGGEETDADETPGTAEGVHVDRFQRIIDLELEQELAAVVEDDGTDHPDEDRRPRHDDRGRCRNGDETTKETVANSHEVPGTREEVGVEEGGQGTTTGGQGGGHGRTRHDVGVDNGSLTHDIAEGARGEAVPAEPQDEGTQTQQGCRVTGHRDRFAFGVEAAPARTDEVSPGQASPTTNHMDDTTAGEVNHPDVVIRGVGEGG